MKRSITLLALMLVSAAFMSYGSGILEKKDNNNEMEIVFVPKLIGIPWYNLVEEGMKEEAMKYDNIRVSMVGAVEPDPVLQARIVEDLIAKEVDAIICPPNDAEAMAPVFKKAREAGILVIAHEAFNAENADLDFEMVNNVKLGESVMKELGELSGGTGDYAVFVGGLTVPSHIEWADSAVNYQKKYFPDMNLVTDYIPCAESVEASHDRTLELIKAYPGISGLAAFGSMGPIGAAQAVREKGVKDSFAVVGTALPGQASQYLNDGTLKKSFIFRPIDIGKSSVWIAKYLLEGGNLEDISEIPGIGSTELQEGKNLIIDGMLEVTSENADSQGF